MFVVSCRYTCEPAVVLNARCYDNVEKEDINKEQASTFQAGFQKHAEKVQAVLAVRTNNYKPCKKGGDAKACQELVHDVLLVAEPALVRFGSGLDQRGGEVARLATQWGKDGITVPGELEKYVQKHFRKTLAFEPASATPSWLQTLQSVAAGSVGASEVRVFCTDEVYTA